MRRGLIPLIAAVGAGLATQSSALAAPALEPMYANDTTVFMTAPAQADGSGDRNVAQDFYLIAYPVLPVNGHEPLCNFSCPGPSNRPPVRDVVLNGSPGFGLDGTAGVFNPNWHVLLLVYKPAWVLSQNFVPARSGAEVDAGEAAGHFLSIASGDNPYERDTGIVFVCVLVSSHA